MLAAQDLSELWRVALDNFAHHLLIRKGAGKLARRNTRAAYSNAVDLFVYGGPIDGFEPVAPWEVTAVTAQAYRQALLAAGRSPATVNQRLAGLREFYRFTRHHYRLPLQPDMAGLIAAGLLWPDPATAGSSRPTVALLPPDGSNPFDAERVTRLEVEKWGRAKFPTRQEMTAIMDQIDLTTLDGKRDYAFFYFMLSTTRRVSEVRLMRWGHIRLQDDGTRVYDYIAKGRKEATAVIGPLAWHAIDHYLRAADRKVDIHNDHFIFVRHRNKKGRCEFNPHRPISYADLLRRLKAYGAAAGVSPDKLHTHALRHRGLRNLKEDTQTRNGQPDMLYIRDKAGHQSMGTTEIYLASTEENMTDRYQTEAEAAHHRQLPPLPYQVDPTEITDQTNPI